MPRSDVQLLIATHKGSESAARELWARHSGPLLAHARAILREPSRAEDAVQQVFCRLLTLDRRTLSRVEDVRAWLAQLVQREALNQLRSLRRENARAGRAVRQAHTQQTPSPAASALDADQDQMLHAALARLARRLREVVVLRHGAGLTFDQIAVALQVNRNTAAGRYRQAMAELRAQLLAPSESHMDTPRSASPSVPTREVNHA